MTHKPDRNRKRISTAASIKGLTAVLKCMLASIFLTCLLPASSLYGQKIAVKSNLLYDLTTTFNIGGEIRCDDTHTLNLSVNYNPWNFGGNKKMKHFLLQPEYRKWFNEVFTGSFIGFQLHYALFNFGGMLPWGFSDGKMLGIENRQIAHNRYQGNLAGFGISYGYQWILAKHWSLEGNIGVGYARVKYEQFECKTCGEKVSEGHKNYLGPTKAAISLIYLF